MNIFGNLRKRQRALDIGMGLLEKLPEDQKAEFGKYLVFVDGFLAGWTSAATLRVVQTFQKG